MAFTISKGLAYITLYTLTSLVDI